MTSPAALSSSSRPSVVPSTKGRSTPSDRSGRRSTDEQGVAGCGGATPGASATATSGGFGFGFAYGRSIASFVVGSMIRMADDGRGGATNGSGAVTGADGPLAPGSASASIFGSMVVRGCRSRVSSARRDSEDQTSI